MARKMLKKLAGLLSACLVLTSVSPITIFAEEAAATNQMVFTVKTAEEMVADMGTGWNLGNTMDGHTGFTPSETIWQPTETTQELIKAVHDAGFNTVRIPTTWGNMIDDANGYSIDEKWISRVQDIVDYCINMNMYVILNVHHDGAEQSGWLRIAAEDQGPVQEKFAGVWKTIAERFKDYDEHLIFESMNEVTSGGALSEAEDTKRIMALNQIFVDTVRATGSNNAERWLSVPGRYTNIEVTTNPANGFELPKDTVENRIFVAVHYYDWLFGLAESLNHTTFTDKNATNLAKDFAKLKDTFTSKGIPVILGEYGAINKNNTADRAYHNEVVNRLCQINGVVPVYWDAGWYDMSVEPVDYSFALIDRATLEHVYPEIIAGIMRGYYHTGKEDLSDLAIGTEVTPLTDLGAYDEAVALKVGEEKLVTLSVDKASSNDVVMWKSSNEAVATVNGYSMDRSSWTGKIKAAGIGYATITAYSYAGQAVLEIPVTVTAMDAATPSEEISMDSEKVEINVGEHKTLQLGIGADTDAYLTYVSANPKVATISKVGKLVGIKAGSTQIIATTTDGKVAVIPVKVNAVETKAEIALALNVYYNDEELEHFTNECADAILVSEDGQYTLSFDAGKHLSAKAKSAGVSGLNNLTAIYIKDDSVTKGKAKKSPLESCDIIYDKIVVDGVELPVTMTEPKSALKASGVFDTNDPINSWDGSAVEGVTVEKHVANFVNMENPQKIEVTFTLSNLVFKEGEGIIAPVEATSIEAVNSAVSTTNEAAGTVEAKLNPKDGGLVTFVSSNPSVIAVATSAVAPVDGIAQAAVYALQSGEATITVYTENGLTAEFTVKGEVIEKVIEKPVVEQPEATDAAQDEAEESTDAAQESAPKANAGIPMPVIIVIIVVAGVGVFFAAMKLASKK